MGPISLYNTPNGTKYDFDSCRQRMSAIEGHWRFDISISLLFFNKINSERNNFFGLLQPKLLVKNVD